ncbi:Alpha/beta hydrolase fold-1 [Diaporthe sp. PMI_573]|nr:Alpha/beta hydrolase fold-1 [Diaporthaceae sp. PMI_573]
MITAGLAAPAKRDILPTVVFTPGAWHGTWAFDTVRSQLEALGYPTEAVALPSVGNTNASVGVAEDAAALAAELATLTDAGKDVVMVCHSYGGVVASSAVEGFGYKDRSTAGLGDNGVIMLVYMTAFAVPAQTSLLDALGGEYLWWMTPDASGDFITASNATQVFYADVANEILVAEAVATLEAEPARIFSDDNKYEPWNSGVEVGFFFTEQDQAIPLATQQSMASQFPSGYVSYTMNSSHSPFMSMPEQVTEGVVLAATQGLAKKLL